MLIRQPRSWLLGVVSLALAACATTTSGSGSSSPTPPPSEVASPSADAIELQAIDTPVPSPSEVADLPGYCAQVARRLDASWPNLEPAAAASLAPAMNEWAMRPGLGAMQEDLATVAMWLLASAGAAASPPADVQAAVAHLKTFAKTNC